MSKTPIMGKAIATAEDKPQTNASTVILKVPGLPCVTRRKIPTIARITATTSFLFGRNPQPGFRQLPFPAMCILYP